eukprot:GEZU01033338.1.p1 GENE.GEZU01033338.1~~GEZU01033338.1.p1  ORF type:complete len:177 (-),score=39.89 GEZU01033338.1:399-875(-)
MHIINNNHYDLAGSFKPAAHDILNRLAANRRSQKSHFSHGLARYSAHKIEATTRVVRNFVNDPSTSKYLCKGDRVLVVVPEEMLVLHPHLAEFQARIGFIVSEVGPSTTAEDELQVKIKNNGDNIESIPAFFLCLEDKVLDSRKNSETTIEASESEEE